MQLGQIRGKEGREKQRAELRSTLRKDSDSSFAFLACLAGGALSVEGLQSGVVFLFLFGGQAAVADGGGEVLTERFLVVYPRALGEGRYGEQGEYEYPLTHAC